VPARKPNLSETDVDNLAKSWIDPESRTQRESARMVATITSPRVSISVGAPGVAARQIALTLFNAKV